MFKLKPKTPFKQIHPHSGIAAQFGEPNHLLDAVKRLKKEGLNEIEVFTPYPVHGIDAILEEKRSKIPWVSFIAGFVGLLVALLMQWWMSGVDYRLNIGGKPFFSGPAFVPIMFEVAVLFSALATFVVVWGACGLPKFSSVFEKDHRALRSTNDEFLVYCDRSDHRFDAARIEEILKNSEAFDIRVVGEL